jgi:hypothetical protein
VNGGNPAVIVVAKQPVATTKPTVQAPVRSMPGATLGIEKVGELMAGRVVKSITSACSPPMQAHARKVKTIVLFNVASSLQSVLKQSLF